MIHERFYDSDECEDIRAHANLVWNTGGKAADRGDHSTQSVDSIPKTFRYVTIKTIRQGYMHQLFETLQCAEMQSPSYGDSNCHRYGIMAF